MYFLLSIISALQLQMAFAEQNSCDFLYAKRIENVQYAVQAATCYQAKMQEEQESLALAWVSLHSESYAQKRAAIDRGLVLADQIMNATPGPGAYWKAVFVTFDCQARDGETMIPRCMIKNLGYIKSLLVNAMNLAPETHAYGPDRVYGMMYMQMPKIVGGNTQTAYVHLKKAYTQAPQLSLNSIYYAKILIKLGMDDEARRILLKLISLSPSQIDPTVLPDVIEDQAEAKKLIGNL